MEKKIKIKKKKSEIDYPILVITYVLIFIGFLMIFSASSIQAKAEFDSCIYFAKKQIIFTVIGTVALFIFSKIDYRIYKEKIVVLAIFTLNVTLLVLTLLVGSETNEAKRWLNIGIRFQTSEFSKFANIVVTAYAISFYGTNLKKFRFVCIAFISTIITVFLIMIQPSFSASLTILITAFGMIFIGGMSILDLLGISFAGVVGIFILAMSKSYRIKRFASFLDPFADPGNTGWQIINSLLAISSGGILGLGFGKSTQKYFYISQPQNDYIFSVICEELGFVRAIILIMIYVYLIFRIFNISFYIKDVFGKMLTIGIGIQIGIQMFMNIAVVISLIPNTGVGLPFISYGGTSIIMFLLMIGVLLNISKHRVSKIDSNVD